MDRSVYGQGDTSGEPYGLAYQPYRLTKKDAPAPGCEYSYAKGCNPLFFLLHFTSLPSCPNEECSSGNVASQLWNWNETRFQDGSKSSRFTY